jgi:hypothetical protein
VELEAPYLFLGGLGGDDPHLESEPTPRTDRQRWQGRYHNDCILAREHSQAISTSGWAEAASRTTYFGPFSALLAPKSFTSGTRAG